MAQNTLKLKEEVIFNFLKPETCTRIIICTEAFGMGMDCPNIKKIIHYLSPSTPDSYIQQTGRGGRDGGQARALCIYAPTKINTSNM